MRSSEKKSLWKRVFGQEVGPDGEPLSPLPEGGGSPAPGIVAPGHRASAIVAAAGGGEGGDGDGLSPSSQQRSLFAGRGGGGGAAEAAVVERTAAMAQELKERLEASERERALAERERAAAQEETERCVEAVGVGWHRRVGSAGRGGAGAGRRHPTEGRGATYMRATAARPTTWLPVCAVGGGCPCRLEAERASMASLLRAKDEEARERDASKAAEAEKLVAQVG